ncbi:chromosome segregation protein SMC [Christensenellaceae bacterium OttesenSCG-928-K19]|nr:chromosome segregation protein SMC [Christensenellaceae bacterium OttesenSCG-928-K19]
MYLKRIELNGFKSFPHKKEIQINGGITGVVGPNGSGKSNIADALRWVLGEQSSKNLRGASMQDIIFNGTQARSKKSYCEVSLVFDNADGRMDLDFTEICVSRKMYRSGESEYAINNAGCRLKDILELFRDTGIGKEGYSIIGQGRIDEILNSKPVQRRKVFEEAAGIAKYRARKEEAERNLQKTSDNIVRIDDIIAELETQIGPLEIQMREAKDYNTLRERLKQLDINLFLYNYDRTAERMKRMDAQVEELEQEFDDLSNEITKMGEQQAEVKQQSAAIQQEIDSHNSRVSGLLQQQEKLKGKRALLEEREKNCRNSMEAGNSHREELEKSIEEYSTTIKDINEKINGLNAVLDEQYAEISGLKEKMLDMAGREDGYAESIEDVRRQAEDLRASLQTCKINYSESTVRMDVLKGKCTELESRLTQHGEHFNGVEQSVAECRRQLEQYEGASAEMRNRSNELAQLMMQSKENEKEKTELLADVTRMLNEDQSRYKLLADMNEDHEGYFDSVRSLLRKSGGEPEISRKIKGVLAEVIDVPKQYETPMEVILGNALQNIVVETDSDAKEIISYLRRNNLGRVTFLPAKSLKVRYLNREEKELLSMPGVLGVASEMIGCEEGIRPAVDFLLARTVIVEDMDCAVALMRKAEYSFRTVTMQGDFIKPGGVITGGSLKQKNTGLLSRKRMADELKKAVEKNKTEQQKLQAELGKSAALQQDLQQEQQKVLEKLRLQEIAQAEVKQQLINYESQIEEKDTACHSLTEELTEAQAELAAITRKANDALDESESLQTAYDEMNAKLVAKEEKRSQGIKENTQMREVLSQMELEHAEKSNEKTILMNESERLKAASFSARNTMGELDGQKESLHAEWQDIKRRKHELNEEIDDSIVEIKNAGAMVQDKLDERERLNNLLEQNEQKQTAMAERKNLLIEQKYKLIANKEKAEIARETMQNKMWEDYGLTYANALDLKDDDFGFQNATRESEEIRNRLREMGAVNPNAIEDYARVSERYENLKTQREDLVQAGDDLKIVIDDLLNGMTASFKEKFDLINGHFMKVFKELFGGGHAEVQLLDEDNIMECGIDIIAEPPGKKLQSITLLSGGEKALTAIALLFAMLSINPSPVCLLDEIDAPLDDANLIRLADYLTKLSKELQFIVITHRKPTMAICDTLYGVAMHEKGVSDIVSVQLEGA